MTVCSDSGFPIGKEELFARLKHCVELPSPPAVALRILELGEDTGADAGDIADLLSKDPALVAKVLRIANSPLYALRRRVDNLQQAVFTIGLNGTITLALSFSLISDLQARQHGSLDYDLYWRRSLLASVCGRVLAEFLQLPEKEDVLLGALLQDIGMLALDRALEGLYSELGQAQSDHDSVRRYEMERLGMDHARIGEWLLGEWNLPPRLQAGVGGSHASLAAGVDVDEPDQLYRHLIAVAGEIANWWFTAHDDEGKRYEKALTAIGALGIGEEAIDDLLNAIDAHIPEVERVYDCRIGDTDGTRLILDRAKEVLLIRNLAALKNTAALQEKSRLLENRAKQLEEQNRRDWLTGLFNREFLDRELTREFERARTHGWSLSLVFIDLDHFKTINDNYGHQKGDAVLTRIGQLLQESCRQTDIVGRYGGEEFVMVMPGSGLAGAKKAANRILEGLRNLSLEIGANRYISVTTSIGIATLDEMQDFDNISDLVEAADRALYAAKVGGRDRLEFARSTVRPTGY